MAARRLSWRDWTLVIQITDHGSSCFVSVRYENSAVNRVAARATPSILVPVPPTAWKSHMARSSSQKFLARNRAPRVVLEYNVELYGAMRRVQLPFVIGVFADLAGTPREPPRPLAERRIRDIDVDTFDARLRELQPRAAFSVPDTIRGVGELAVDLTFQSIDDFLPTSIVRKIPSLDALLNERIQLTSLSVYMDGKSGSEVLVERILNDQQLQNEAFAAKSSTSAPADQTGESSEESLNLLLQNEFKPNTPEAFAEKSPASALADQPPESSEDSLGSLLQKEFKPKTPQAFAELASALKTLVEQRRTHGGPTGKDPTRFISELVTQIDYKLGQQVNLVLHHRDFQKLEGAWRGLHYLVSNTETDELLKIRFLSVSKAELDRMISRYRGDAWEQSPLFRMIYEEAYGTFGGEPYGCLVGDYEFSHGKNDVDVLRGIAKIAAHTHAPFLAAGSPQLLKMETWQQVARPRDMSSVFSAPEYAEWRALRESDDSRYLALTVPRCLARLPYGNETNPVEEFDFEEAVRGPDASCFVWANSAYALAANIARSFNLFGWCAQFRGVESGGLVEGLPCHQFPSEEGDVQLSSTEIAISDRWEAELSRSGLIPLLNIKNTGSAVFVGARSLHRPAVYDDPDVTARAALEARLPYLLTSCRLVHYMKCIVRDRIGSFASREDMERQLNDWVSQYVEHDQGSTNQESKARRPLAEAQVVIEPIEGNSAAYLGKFYLRPQYQLEGLTVPLRLTARLLSRG